MKKTFDNLTNVTISGFDLNNIADYADIDTTQLIGSVDNILYCAERNTIDHDDLYYLAHSAIRVVSSINALRDTIKSAYESANNNSTQ